MDSFKKMFRLFKPYFTPFKKQIVSFVFVSSIFFSLQLVQPFLLGDFVDQLMTDLRPETIWRCCGIFLAVAVLSVLLTYYVKVTTIKLQCRVPNYMKSQFFIHYQRTSPRFHLQKNAAAIVDKVNNDIELMMMYFLNLGIKFVGNLLMFVLATLYIFLVDVWCGVAVLAFLPLLELLNRLFRNRIYRASQAVAENRSQYFAALSEQFHSVRSIRLNQLTDVLARRFGKAAKKMEHACVAQEKVTFPYSIINENMDTLLKLFLFAYGGYAVLDGRMTVGQFTILYSYMALVTSSFSYFLTLGQQTQERMAYYTRLKELADVPEECNGTQVSDQLEEIAAQNLHFGYDDREILTGLNRSFKKDKIYCLVGHNGAGKSTLANLLLGLYIDDTGETVLYNGTPIRDIDMRAMRAEKFGVSEQEPTMLTGSVAFNITYREELPQDTEKLGRLFDTVNFRCGEASTPEELLALDASALSGGQKQKVSIIKALYKDPQLLLLDEPTSALDAASRKCLARHLKENAPGRITILISHDQELIDIADEVVKIGE